MVGLMVTLLSFVMKTPPGPIQLIITELYSTPLTVLTVQVITSGLPTKSGKSLLIICVPTEKEETVCKVDKSYKSTVTVQSIYVPVTSSVILSSAITSGSALIITSHWIILPSSVVLNCEIV